MNKKQEYEQLCRIRNVLLIAAILLAFAAAVAGVKYFSAEPPESQPIESTAETTEENTADPAAETSEETKEPESTSAEEDEQVTTEGETAESGEYLDDGTEAPTESGAEPTEQADASEDKEMDLERVLNGVLHNFPEVVLERFERYAQQIIPDDVEKWEITARIQADAWFDSLIDDKGSNARQMRAVANWNAIQENWDIEDPHSEKAEQLYAFLDAFFADKEQMAEGGQPV